MHYDFSIDSKRLWILAVGTVFLLVLVYAAGWFSGILWSGSVAASRKPVSQTSFPVATATAPKPSIPLHAPAAAPPAKAPTASVPAPIAVASAPPVTGLATATATAPKPSLPLQAPAAAPPAKAPTSSVPAPIAVASAPPVTGSATAPAPLPKPPANPPAAKQKPASPPPIRKASVQVGAYRMKANALAMVKKLAKKGYSPYIFQTRDFSKRLWYTVRIGAFGNLAEARQTAARFKKKEGADAVVVGFRSLAPIGKRK